MRVFDDYDEDEAPAEGITCIYCNASGFVWEDNGSGFKLYTEDHQKHVCTGRNKPSADDFDAL
jgi:hypothetical protein